MKLPVVRGIRLLGIRLLVAVVTSTVLFIPLGAQEEAAAATVLRVPQDHPTIQAAIDAAVSGDTVLVSPGTYVERIDYRDKEITVESTDGPATTIIDGNQTAGVVRRNLWRRDRVARTLRATGADRREQHDRRQQRSARLSGARRRVRCRDEAHQQHFGGIWLADRARVRGQ